MNMQLYIEEDTLPQCSETITCKRIEDLLDSEGLDKEENKRIEILFDNFKMFILNKNNGLYQDCWVIIDRLNKFNKELLQLKNIL